MPDGTTQGTTCGYCKRIWEGRVKCQGVLLSKYKGQLGTDEKLLNVHTTMIATVTECILKKGCVRNSQLDWEEISVVTLKTVKMMETVVKRPGWQHLPWDYYTSQYGDFYANLAGQEAGHREFTFEGKRGVLIPDAPVTRIEFNERIQGILEEEVRKSDGTDLLSTDEMEANLKGLAGTFSNLGKGTSASHGGLLGLAESASGDLSLLLGPRVWGLGSSSNSWAPTGSLGLEGGIILRRRSFWKRLLHFPCGHSWPSDRPSSSSGICLRASRSAPTQQLGPLEPPRQLGSRSRPRRRPRRLGERSQLPLPHLRRPRRRGAPAPAPSRRQSSNRRPIN